MSVAPRNDVGLDPGPKPGLTLKDGTSLPEAYKASFFGNPEGLTDKQLSVRIADNPIVDLCLRISTSRVGRNNKRCFDPKRYGVKQSHSARLYQMIGKDVGRPTYRRMCQSSERQWKFVEECWIANMHTVLLNRYFDPLRLDRKLFGAIRRYKIWFLRFFFSGSLRKVRRRDGRLRQVFKPVNFEKGLKALKSLSGILQWAAMSDLKEENASPPSLPFWKGWHSELSALELVWFDGHLSRWKSALTDLKFTDDELTNLCQIRTFGRALPCPTRQMCQEAFDEQVKVLSTERPLDPTVKKVVTAFSKRLALRLDIEAMPYHSHISVSTSGCFERSQREFGLAGEVSSWIDEIDVTFSEVVVHGFSGPGSFPSSLLDLLQEGVDLGDFRDVYGDMLFPRPKSFYRVSRAFSKARDSGPRLLDSLFGSSGQTTRKRLVSRYVKGAPLPNSLGRIVLWLSSSKALEQGFYTNENGVHIKPYCWFEVGNQLIPVFHRVQMDYHLTYNPVDCPKTKLDCLAEPGAKTRPLGKNQAWFTMVTRAMRFMAEPILARDGRARIGLRSTNKMWSFLKFLKKSSEEFNSDVVCQSTDAKSATDYMSLELIEAIWNGFLEPLPDKHPFKVFASLITCQRMMFSPKRYSRFGYLPEEGRLNLCGSFMGEPLSFLSLTLVNLLVEEISAHYYLSGSELWSPAPAPDLVGDPVCICGDDFAALRRNLRRIRLFKKVFLDMRMVFSWKDGSSRRVLVFCEDHVLVQRTGKEKSFLYVDVIKSRLLTTMSREHSENRSSILGKGRMLSNQLDYFEDKNLKIAVLGYYGQVFDRAYDYSVIGKIKLPLYLPPCAGGAGIPVVESVMPDFMWPYIGYIIQALKEPDFFTRYCEFESLSALNSRVKHGLSIKDSNILRSECSRYKFNTGGSDVKPNVIYDDDFVKTLLEEVYSVEIPTDPYLKKYDFEALKNECSRIGFVQFSSLSEEIERILNFQAFFTSGSVREQRTFNQWVKDSRKFWRGRVHGVDPKPLVDVAKAEFKGLRNLETQITRGFSGWIFIGDSDDAFNLVNSGPSLKLNFTSCKVTSLGRVHGTRGGQLSGEPTTVG